MKPNVSVFRAGLLCVSSCIFSCIVAFADTHVGGTISANTTWDSSENPYITDSPLTVNAGVTLTILPVVILRFGGAHSLTVNGTLTAVGDEVNQITFTSNQPSPGPGDWIYIYFNSTSTNSFLEHCMIEYGGYSGHPTIYCYQSSPSIRHNTIRQLSSNAIYVSWPAYPVIDDNLISNCGNTAIYLENQFTSNLQVINNVINSCAGYAIFGMAEFHNNSGSNNTMNGIKLPNPGYGAITGHLYGDNNLAYIGPFYVPGSGSQLTIDPGSVIKFNESSWSTNGGNLIAQGTEANPIVFTSIHDDSWAGDTNNNGSATSPAQGDWRGLYLTFASSSTIFDHTIIRYGGYAGENMIYCDGGPLTITNSDIGNCGSNGLYIASTSNPPVVDTNTIHHCGTNGIYFDNYSDTGLIQNNTITYCGNYAIKGMAEFHNNSGSNNTINGIKLPSPASSMTIWGHLYGDNSLAFIGPFTVPSGRSLTIDPGVVVKFDQIAQSQINGTFNAEGDPANPIVFTSMKDDSHAGDTNNDGSASSPAAGDWLGFYLYNSPAAGFDQCVVRYGGYSGFSMFSCDGTPLTITNCDVGNCANDAIQIQNIQAITIDSNVIHHCGNRGIYYYNLSDDGLITNNIFNDNANYMVWGMAEFHGNSGSNNRVNGIKLPEAGGYSITGRLYGDNDIAFIGPVQVAAGTSMTMDPGVVLKCDTAAWITIRGLLEAHGTAEHPVVFTSMWDDAWAGDTDNYGSAYAPNPGDWLGLYIGESEASAVLDHIVIQYGGYSLNSMIYCYGASMSLTNSEISYSASDAVLVQNTQTITIDSNLIHHSGNLGINYENFNDEGLIQNNVISNCASYAIWGMAEFHYNSGSNSWINGIKLPPSASGYSITGHLYGDNSLAFIGPVIVASGTSLIMDPGVVMKSNQAQWNNISGTLDAQGTQDHPVVFTSMRDDTWAGDTNNDGSGTSPASGDWLGIYISTPGTDSILENCIIQYGGYNGNAMIEINGSSAGIYGTTVRRGSGIGAHLTNSSSEIINCSFTSNGNTGLVIDNSNSEISNVTITENSAYGFVSYSSSGILINSIIWGNTPGSIFQSGGIPNLQFCDVQNGWGDPSDHNIDADPLFIAGPYGDYYLTHHQPLISPCIDAGSDSADTICYDGIAGTVCMSDLTDELGSVQDSGTVDMGVHYPLIPGESCDLPIPIDCNSGMVTGGDLSTKFDNMSEYGCGQEYAGGDEIWVIETGTAAWSIIVTLDDSTDSAMDLIASTTCPPGSDTVCADNQLVLDCVFGQAYIIVDHPDTSPGGIYSLTIQCSDCPGETCAQPIEIPCNTCVTGFTSGFANDHIDCGNGNFAGPDVVYHFAVTGPIVVTIRAEAEFDADFTLASMCDDGQQETELSCEDWLGPADPQLSCGSISAAANGSYTYSWTASTGSYYFWIDGFTAEDSGAYAFELSCATFTPTPTITPDITITPTSTSTPTWTFTSTATNTATPSQASTPTRTATPSNTANPPTNTPTRTFTPISTFTATPSQTSTPTRTATPTSTANPPTSTPTWTPTQMPTITATPVLTSTPIPPTSTPVPATGTPISTPSPSPTSGCTTTGVTVSMPSHVFHAGDLCSCSATVCNASGSTISGYPLFVILEVYGSYYFAPSFDSYDNYLISNPDFPTGQTVIEVLSSFNWPEDVGSASGMIWYGALTNPEITDLYGSLGTWDFGWEP